MPSVIERASSARAKCRACAGAIARGELRFGEALPNAYGEGESRFWFHLPCAACVRPESLLPVLLAGAQEIPGREQLRGMAQDGLDHPRLCRLLRAERASSGRARCRKCREPIAQGAWRLALHLFEDGRLNPIGTIHAECAVPYFEAEPGLERFQLPSNELSVGELAEVVQLMRAGATRAAELPGLAKVAADEPESTRKSS